MATPPKLSEANEALGRAEGWINEATSLQGQANYEGAAAAAAIASALANCASAAWLRMQALKSS